MYEVPLNLGRSLKRYMSVWADIKGMVIVDMISTSVKIFFFVHAGVSSYSTLNNCPVACLDVLLNRN